MKYIKPFDSLRGIAVLLVVTWHWFHEAKINTIPNGPIGVTLFFVLSGFLITSILLNGRNRSEHSGTSKTHFLKTFFARRALRIFPIYYLVIIPFLLYALIHHQEVSKYWYYLTYTSNFYFYKQQDWDPYLAHIWTLAVEEQFYLVWPLLMVFLRKKYVLPCMLLFTVTGVLSQCMAGENDFANYLTLSCFDSLGMGAVLAWVSCYKPQFLGKLVRASGILSLIVLPLLAVEIFSGAGFFLPLRMQLSLIACFIVSYIVYTSQNGKLLPAVIRRLLHNPLLVQIGKVSYGIYLYHLLIPYAVLKVYGKISFLLPVFVKDHFGVFFSFGNVIALVVVSVLSWHFIEKPMLGFKKYFTVEEAGIKEKAKSTRVPARVY